MIHGKKEIAQVTNNRRYSSVEAHACHTSIHKAEAGGA
jgi:hypothetical protein